MTEELSPSQVAERIGATTRSVQRWIAAGRLPARRVGGRWRVAIDAIDAFVAQPSTAPARQPRDRSDPDALHRESRRDRAPHHAGPASGSASGRSCPHTDGPGRARPPRRRGGRRGRRVPAGADALHPGSGSSPRTPTSPSGSCAAGIRWVGPPPDGDPGDGRQGRRAPARGLARRPGPRPATTAPTSPTPRSTRPRDGSATRSSSSRRPAAAARACASSATGPASGTRSPPRGARRPAAFGDDRLILERLVEGARHVEIQVLFDAAGDGVHLGERDCSIQRRHQKVLEETPSPAVDADLRATAGRCGPDARARGRLRERRDVRVPPRRARRVRRSSR